MHIRKLSAAIFMVAFVLGGACYGSIIYDTSAIGELTGSRSVGTGITADGIYGTGFTLSWNIADLGAGTWQYTYTASGYSGRGAGLSHLIIDLSDDCYQPGDAGCVTNALLNGGSIVGEIQDYSSTGQGNSNPNLPNNIIGVKFNLGESNDSPQVFSFESNRAPVYGDFYAKAGKGDAYNSGNANHGSAAVMDFVARPDGSPSAVPEPGSALLLLTGAALIAASRLRSRSRASSVSR